ncbi:MAG: hypothetical protein ACRER8_21920 [Pseudomonas sp.]|uniref:hypothetical protein n=1 Tax=Pseudomonas sp. TaxID=306 RepID=UPI003D6E421C
MNHKQRFMGSMMLLVATMAIASFTYAAYPKKMAITVELWNDSGADLYLAAASWVPPDTELSAYVIAHDSPTTSFSLVLNNPRNDLAIFRMREGARECEFTLGHKTTFSWFGLDPSPEKFARARSSGTVPAQCSASVIKGSKSMAAYTVRVRMS